MRFIYLIGESLGLSQLGVGDDGDIGRHLRMSSLTVGVKSLFLCVVDNAIRKQAKIMTMLITDRECGHST